MGRLFLILYHHFNKHRPLFFTGVIVLFLIAVFLASKLNFEEDIIELVNNSPQTGRNRT